MAVELGLQPLGVTGTIDDWRTQDVPRLEANLRAAIRPGGIVLAHDGGGDRRGTVQALGTCCPSGSRPGGASPVRRTRTSTTSTRADLRGPLPGWEAGRSGEDAAQAAGSGRVIARWTAVPTVR